ATGRAEEREKGSEAEGSEAPSEDEMPCPNCGTMISKEATVCYACGEEVTAGSKGTESAPAKQEAGEPVIIKKPPVFVKKVMKKKIG
ncbi:MAG: zinc ribbon domain-containing protein, partial [Thermoplasmata archaeon]